MPQVSSSQATDWDSELWTPLAAEQCCPKQGGCPGKSEAASASLSPGCLDPLHSPAASRERGSSLSPLCTVTGWDWDLGQGIGCGAVQGLNPEPAPSGLHRVAFAPILTHARPFQFPSPPCCLPASGNAPAGEKAVMLCAKWNLMSSV